jgi:hypothetical protein
MRTVTRPLDEALAAIDAFEQEETRVLLGRDREFLDRLRSNKHADQVNRIWSAIEGHRKTPDDDQIIIKNAVYVLRVATTYWKLPEQLDEQKKKSEKVRMALRLVRSYFSNDREPHADQLRKTLDWADRAVDRGFKRFGGLSIRQDGTITSAYRELPRWLRLTRKGRTTASQYAMFMEAMSDTFRGVFGKPCDEAVAALTDVAFSTSRATTVDQVRNATKRYIRRKIQSD